MLASATQGLIEAHPPDASGDLCGSGRCRYGAANDFAMSERDRVERTGAMALACGRQVTKMTGGVLPGSVTR